MGAGTCSAPSAASGCSNSTDGPSIVSARERNQNLSLSPPHGTMRATGTPTHPDLLISSLYPGCEPLHGVVLTEGRGM
jgi:hypothetical protein